MKLQIIKDLDSSGSSIMYFIWTIGEDGKKIKCVECSGTLAGAEAKFEETLSRVKLLENFKPEVLKSVDL